jgi:hypothetical protein
MYQSGLALLEDGCKTVRRRLRMLAEIVVFFHRHLARDRTLRSLSRQPTVDVSKVDIAESRPPPEGIV